MSDEFFKFTKDDYKTVTWKTFQEGCQARIDHLRKKNDSLSIDEKQTTINRTRIDELKYLMALGDPRGGPAPSED